MDSYSGYLNKLINSSLPSLQEKSLEGNISILKKYLCKKDGIIKKLVETQSTVRKAISAKSNNQHSKTKLRTPEHITNKLIKLDGIPYNYNELMVADTTSTRKRTNNDTSNEFPRPSVVVNNHPENHDLYGREPSASESKIFKKRNKNSYFWRQYPSWLIIT